MSDVAAWRDRILERRRSLIAEIAALSTYLNSTDCQERQRALIECQVLVMSIYSDILQRRALSMDAEIGAAECLPA